MTAVDNYQESLVLNRTIATTGLFPSRNATDPFIAEIRTFAFNFAPLGWAPTDGQLLPINQNSALFSLLGTNFGGDGSTDFGLPNLQDRSAIHAGQGPGLSPQTLGDVTGVDDVNLVQNNIPPEVGDTGQPFDNYQPSLPLNYYINLVGDFPSQGVGSTANGFLGQVIPFGGNFAPRGTALADGQLLAINQHQALFSLLGTTFGGDGRTTFALPDLRGRTVIGTSDIPADNATNGQSSGTPNVTLTDALIPSSIGGGDQPFDNRQPSLAMNYIIATSGNFPDQNSGPVDPTVPFLGEISIFAGTFAPSGWEFARGQLLDVATNPGLFSLLGTVFGGDGRTTFALPDLRGRSIVHDGQEFAFGTAFGSDSVTVTDANLPVINDTLIGDENPNGLAGGAGDDRIEGRGDSDTLLGQRGNDTILGEGGNDTISGGSGDDNLDGGTGADDMSGGTGNDMYTVDDAGDTVTELAGEGTDTVMTDLFAFTLGDNVENLTFTNGGNHVGRGNLEDNTLIGSGNNEQFVIDFLGADSFDGGAGDDAFDGRLHHVGMALRLDTGIHGGSLKEDSFTDIERFFGSATADDYMRAGTTGMKFHGYGGDDTLVGGNEVDFLQGGAGNDLLVGLDGDDTLRGGADNDTMNGGNGSDVFLYVDSAFGQDTIDRFEDGLDRLKIYSSVATQASDFTITGNGTSSVMLTLNTAPTNTITINGAGGANVTITDADMLFY